MMSKKNKKKGPIRIEAIIPITVVLVLFGAYFKYFFDSHLRAGLEYGATQAHGAEVNISSLSTSFTEPSIRIRRIQVTDKSEPRMNLIEIGEVKLKLLWDALLRGKFVIPESSILGIQVKTERRRPGRILPPSKSSGPGVSGMAEEAAMQTIDQLRQQNEENLLADIFSVAGGTDYKDQLKKMEAELGTQQKIKQLDKELKAKEKEWKERIKNLPEESEIKQLVKKVEGLKFDSKNLAQSLKVVDQVYKEGRAKYKTVEAAKKAFDQDIKKYDNEYKGLEKMVQDDINNITRKLNIPSLDPKEINKMLLGNIVANQLGSLMRYKNMAREYMPTKSAQERKADKKAMMLTPTERANGVNFSFPKKKSYPRVWLQKAQISSDSKQGEAGDLVGTLKNVTDNPKHLGIPATLDFSGGFPKQQIMDVKGKITIDHTTDVPVETGVFSVGSFPVSGNKLTESKDVSLGYDSAIGQSQIRFELKDQALSMQSNSLFTQVAFVVAATDKNVKRLLDNVVNDLKNLDLNIRAKGSWNDLSLNINSNLGTKLANAIKAQISGEIKKARKQVEDHVRGLVDKEKGKLQGEFKKLEKELGVSLKSREDAVNSIKTTADKKVNDAKKQEQKKLEKKGKKELKKLLKGIKF